MNIIAEAYAIGTTPMRPASGIMSGESLLLPLLILVAVIFFWLWALIDILKSDFKDYNKIVWLLSVLLVPVLGFILYFLIGKKQKI